MKKEKKEEGNILIVAMIFVAIGIVVILFIATIFMCYVNTILYHIKLEMYSINKSAIIAVNKNKTSMDDFSYHKKSYQTYFENALKKNFHLSDTFQNKEGMVEEVNIMEYEIIEKGKRDSYTKEKCDDRIIHTVIQVKIKPIILKSAFEKILQFEVHEDVSLNLVGTR